VPARQAGLKAVYIPHDHTWVLEKEEFLPDQDTLYLRTFAELLSHF
jgi:putative hydrolase of the HAD superfamily